MTHAALLQNFKSPSVPLCFGEGRPLPTFQPNMLDEEMGSDQIQVFIPLHNKPQPCDLLEGRGSLFRTRAMTAGSHGHLTGSQNQEEATIHTVLYATR